MNPNLKCHFVKQLAIYSQRMLYGYRCDMEPLFADIETVRRFITIEDHIIQCALNGTIINDLNEYRRSIQSTYTKACRGC